MNCFVFSGTVSCKISRRAVQNQMFSLSLKWKNYALSTMGVSKELISKFLIGNRFPIKNLLIDSLLTPIVESTYLKLRLRVTSLRNDKRRSCVTVRSLLSARPRPRRDREWQQSNYSRLCLCDCDQSVHRVNWVPRSFDDNVLSRMTVWHFLMQRRKHIAFKSNGHENIE